MTVLSVRTSAAPLYPRYCRAIEGERLPLALVDLDALEGNVDRVALKVRPFAKKIRVATKSVRAPDLLRRISARLGSAFGGWMTYDAAETAFLASHGFDDLLLAYPTLQSTDASLLGRVAAEGRKLAVIVDDIAHVAALSAAAIAHHTTLRLVIDLDVAYRPLPTSAVHLGVRRSPLRAAREAVALHTTIRSMRGVRLVGLMAYEAQIAGVSDDSIAKRAMKAVSRVDVAKRRASIVAALRDDGAALEIVNGGGTGSLASSASESVVTEVTAGSGFLCSHLFDDYVDLGLTPAAYFALQITRAPSDGIFTCAGGGFIASGAAARDRLPRPVLPEGLELLALEGAGEVQTPLRARDGLSLRKGDPVFFRHAKAGELAEHFRSYALVRGDRIEARAETYRGLGECFLG